jgi:hypothetical protein
MSCSLEVGHDTSSDATEMDVVGAGSDTLLASLGGLSACCLLPTWRMGHLMLGAACTRGTLRCSPCWFAGVPVVDHVCFVGYGLPGGRGVLQLFCGISQGWT